MPDVALVIPCYNEEDRLPVDELAVYLQARDDRVICFVDDGSRDGTFALLTELRDEFPDRVVVERHEQNAGKAAAVRTGVQLMLQLSPPPAAIGFLDADLSTDLDDFERLVDELDRSTACEVALGSRVRSMGRRIERTPYRHYLGRLFSVLAGRILRIPIYDTQCGAKLFQPAAARVVFAEPPTTTWSFDVEVLARYLAWARQTRGHDVDLHELIREVPLDRWRDVRGSKLRFRDYFIVLRELGSLYARRDEQPAITRGEPGATPAATPAAVPVATDRAA